MSVPSVGLLSCTLLCLSHTVCIHVAANHLCSGRAATTIPAIGTELRLEADVTAAADANSTTPTAKEARAAAHNTLATHATMD